MNGGDWAVPMSAVSATVNAPGGSVQQATCFLGPAGSAEPCRIATTGEAARSFVATRPLAVGEQLTIVTGLRPGAVSVTRNIVGRPRGFVDYFSTSPLALGAAAVVLVGGLFLVWWIWWTRGRDRGRARGAVVAEYEPPAKLRPAQLGVLVDETADPRDLVATIVDLAVRGYLAITEHPKQGFFGHTDWTFDKKKPGDELLAYEQRLFDGIFANGGSVLLSSLRGHFAATLRKRRTTRTRTRRSAAGSSPIHRGCVPSTRGSAASPRSPASG